MQMNQAIAGVLAGAIVLAGGAQAASAQATGTPSPSTVSDNIGEDGLKRRGDGSIDGSLSAEADDGGRVRGRGGDRERDRQHSRD